MEPIRYITVHHPILKTDTKYSWKFLMPNGSPILKFHKQHYPIRYQSRVYLTSQVPKWVFYGVLVCINPKLYVLICMGFSGGSRCKNIKWFKSWLIFFENIIICNYNSNDKKHSFKGCKTSALKHWPFRQNASSIVKD